MKTRESGWRGREDRPRPPYDWTVGPGEDADNRKLGELLKEFRVLAGFSRAAAAKLAGVSAEYVRLIESGQRTPALGQTRIFLELYSAVAAVEEEQKDGSRPDLMVIPPGHDEPILIEFTSRIRESRSWAFQPRPPVSLSFTGVGVRKPSVGADSSSGAREAELGAVVALLAQADMATLRGIRELLERGP